MRFAIVAATVLAFAGAAAAQTTRKVPKDYDTIQEAEDDCDEGDTILVAKGRYHENVNLNVPGVTITGAGAIWDGNIDGSDGNCLNVNAADVTVQGFTFRNGSRHIYSDGNNLVIQKCSFLDSSGTAVYINSGTNATVQSCKFYGTGNCVLECYDPSALITKCIARSSDDYGIYLEDGAGTEIIGNTLSYMEDGYAIYVSGTGADVSKNKIFACDEYAIYLDSDSAKVAANSVKKVHHYDDAYSYHGIRVNGTSALVEKNQVMDVHGGIYVSGNDAEVFSNKVSDTHSTSAIEVYADNLKVIGNTTRFGTDDSSGFSLGNNSATGSGVIENNKASDTIDAGFYFGDLYGVTVKNCSAANCGAEDESGIRITAEDCDFEKLMVSNVDNCGIELRGYAGVSSGNQFTNCVVKNILGDGFRVYIGNETPDNNTFTNCVATGCGADGFDNRGTATKLIGGKYRGESFDITNNSSGGATFSGGLGTVDFVTGGSTQQSFVD